MSKPQIASPDEEPTVEVNVNVDASPATDIDEHAAASAEKFANSLQASLDRQRQVSDAVDAAGVEIVVPPDPQPQPQQPYMLESAAWKADLEAKHSSVSAEIGKLEATRDGLNARIDDLNALRNSVKAGMDVLK